MSGERVAGKVIFETQSTHKMLAALSQASLIHIKGEYDEEAFNEAFMMHTTTSPSYPIVASVETAAAMLRGNPGKRLINRARWSGRCIFAKRSSGCGKSLTVGFSISGNRRRWMKPNAGPLRQANSGTALTMRMPIICFSIRLKSLF